MKKMSRSGGNYRYRSIVSMVTVLFLVLGCDTTQPTTYYVGDEFGWDLTISMEAWPNGKTFYAGDLLVFKYDDYRYNVVVVNEKGWETCTANKGAQVYTSGDDTIQLGFGEHYFISTYYGDECAAGMKMFINATSRPPTKFYLSHN